MVPRFRFHNAEHEPSMERAVVPSIRDDIQLSVEIYRSKLYELIASRKNRVRNHVAKGAQHSKGANRGSEETSSSMTASCHNIDQTTVGKARHRSGTRSNFLGHENNRKSMEMLESTSLKPSEESIDFDPNAVFNSNHNVKNSICGKVSRIRSNSVSTPLHRSRSELRNSKSGTGLYNGGASQSCNVAGGSNTTYCSVSPIHVPKNASPPRVAFAENNNNTTVKNSRKTTSSLSLDNASKSSAINSCTMGNNNNNNNPAIKVKVMSRRLDNMRGSTSTVYMHDHHPQHTASQPQHHRTTNPSQHQRHQYQQLQGASKSRVSPSKSNLNDKTDCLSGKSSASSSSSNSSTGSDLRATRRSTDQGKCRCNTCESSESLC